MSHTSLGKLSTHRLSALKDMLAAKPNFSSENTISDFISTYFLCEALANRLIGYFDTDNPSKCAQPKKIRCSNCGIETPCRTAKKRAGAQFKTLDVGKIKKAIAYFSLNFSEFDADAVFRSGTGKVGNRTARQLRNEYAHSLSMSAKEEIATRSTTLISSMTRFCKAVEDQML